MNERKSHTDSLKLISKVAFFLYGLFCVVTQSAYSPASPHDDFLYTRMDGRYAIAFGGALIFIGVSVGSDGRLLGKGSNHRAAWIIRAIGFAIAVGLGWYALLGGTNVG